MLKLKVIHKDFCVCKVENLKEINFSDEFCFIGKTDEEISVVCTCEKCPKNTTACEQGWKAFRIQGTLDFSLIGILSKISSVLAENKIGIFAVSTYNTDYILVKADCLEQALSALEAEGFQVER
ncbi:MAG: ACT domain-containing protein [Eubacteriales bacterium]|nr:ACT domain-containing protein [Eubacteriales bacterium]